MEITTFNGYALFLIFFSSYPVIWSRHNGHRWFFTSSPVILPSFVPVSPIWGLCPLNPSTLSQVFFRCSMSIICLQARSRVRLLTCPKYFICGHHAWYIHHSDRSSCFILSFRVTSKHPYQHPHFIQDCHPSNSLDGWIQGSRWFIESPCVRILSSFIQFQFWFPFFYHIAPRSILVGLFPPPFRLWFAVDPMY